MTTSPTYKANVVAMLTNRERQIMRLVSEGLSNKEIGRRLNIADRTLRIHLHDIFEKMEIGTEPRSRRSP
jgi:two-component system, NarL family, nitrate/nitrite response regulator NarL